MLLHHKMGPAGLEYWPDPVFSPLELSRSLVHKMIFGSMLSISNSTVVASLTYRYSYGFSKTIHKLEWDWLPSVNDISTERNRMLVKGLD